jgi:predicted Rossmann-fold nucleotide-binding protein
MLVGSTYWSGLVDWVRATVIAEGKVSEEDLGMLRVTDDVDEVVEAMVQARLQHHDPEPG